MGGEPKEEVRKPFSQCRLLSVTEFLGKSKEVIISLGKRLFK